MVHLPWTQGPEIATTSGIRDKTAIESEIRGRLDQLRPARLEQDPDVILRAAIRAMRSKAGELKRKSQVRVLAIQLSRRLGNPNRAMLASHLGITLRSLQRAEQKDLDARAVLAALRLLGLQARLVDLPGGTDAGTAA